MSKPIKKDRCPNSECYNIQCRGACRIIKRRAISKYVVKTEKQRMIEENRRKRR